MPIKTFRGKLANDTTEVIRLSTLKGMMGYKINKFQGMPDSGSTDLEAVVKIYRVDQTVSATDSGATTDIDFSDNTLMAAMILIQDDSHENWSQPVVIFDREIINQDIFITNKCHDKSGPANYYLELEQVKLDINEATVATLKDIRNV